ncbi:MAG: GNAT family N-acetyltransferase [Defluviitaleaceae bacterium]|nr:GNAT family N-acetyltransferase [Defluviitaleaceae bacterium]
MKYFKKIAGERLYLSPICTDDFEIYTKWLNDYDVAAGIGQYPKMIGIGGEKKILERLAADEQCYAMVLYETDELIGNIGLHNIDDISRSAEIGLFIGEAANRGKGYGAEALGLMLNFAFESLNLRNVMLQLNSDNERAFACYRKTGFREIGRRRSAKFKDGKYIDVIYMDIVKDEFRK